MANVSTITGWKIRSGSGGRIGGMSLVSASHPRHPGVLITVTGRRGEWTARATRFHREADGSGHLVHGGFAEGATQAEAVEAAAAAAGEVLS